MNIQQRIDELKRQQAEQDLEIAELEKLLEKDWRSKLVQPKEGGYYFITTSMDNGFSIDHNSYNKRKPEHAFEKEEHAELVKEKMLLMQEMMAFAHVKNEGWEPDWCDPSVTKWGILSDRYKPYVDKCIHRNWFLFGVTVKTQEIAIEMLEEFGGRLLEYYNTQY